MQQIDSSSSSWTSDALGRWVEKANSGGSYVQAVYDPTGHLLAQMNNGPTLRQARVPLVGGAMAQYVWTGLNVYEHRDWLGNAATASVSGEA